MNPFSGERIELPPSTKPIRLENLRVITSTNPSDANCLFLAIQSCCSLAFCRQGHKSWTCLNFGLCFCDAIFYKGEFYAIDISNCLFHLNCNLHHEAKRLNLRNLIIGMSNSTYLVELNGDLLLVVRLMNERFAQEDSLYRSNYVDHFKVYKFDWVKKKWILVTRIGNYAILLGKYSSISIPNKLCRYFKANYIYLIDDSSSNFPYECEFPNRETGLYDTSTYRIKLLYQSSSIWTNKLQWFRPRE
ncbi:hypothetical protein Ddye_027535 [Dipteronia dyeriana]|uniref:KIB1-4 beta-propeller domain-containing protein n=1 Tax=Dipteronia dyeriana TaxID=168575 RepID=A0AAD9TPA8_9ROSI|nr:hypothetical protein Ddye_027535 [Dipteronia dyeriana]